MKNIKAFGLFTVAAIAITGCSGLTSSSEYKSLKSEVDGIQFEVDSLQEKVDSAEGLEKKLDEIIKEGQLLVDDLSTLLSLPSRRSAAVTKFGLPACKTFTYASSELTGISDDPDDIANRMKIKQSVRDHDWSALFNRSEEYSDGLNQYITELDFAECSNTHVGNWLKENCETFDRLMLKKDTNSYIGKCLKGTVKISQSDAATGPCAFQGYISGDYDVRAQFGATLDTAKHAADTNCDDQLRKLTEGKTVQFRGWVIGSYTYTTTSNGSQTIPAFKIISVG
jgi:hypothetical protein